MAKDTISEIRRDVDVDVFQNSPQIFFGRDLNP